MAITKIEWTATHYPDGTVTPGYTFNPWIGCAKVSAGCKLCYAENMMDKRYGKAKWGVNGTRVKTSGKYWNDPLKWNLQAAENGTRSKVFCASLADVFEQRNDLVLWRAELMHLIRLTPYLDWLLLTKRPESIERGLRESQLISEDRGSNNSGWLNTAHWLYNWVEGAMFPKNVWLGTSVENQQEAELRIPALFTVSARVKFLSMEPLLGPVNLDEALAKSGYSINGWNCLDWVIVGGESGAGARPMHPDWVRSIRDQCQAAGVPFFFKQWGAWENNENCPDRENHKTHDWLSCTKLNLDGSTTLYGTPKVGYVWIDNVGKHAAGRSLDGKTYDEFPTTALTPA